MFYQVVFPAFDVANEGAAFEIEPVNDLLKTGRRHSDGFARGALNAAAKKIFVLMKRDFVFPIGYGSMQYRKFAAIAVAVLFQQR